MKKKTTWVLVADGARARILTKNGGELENATGIDYVGENLKEHEIVSDAPGRSFQSMSSTRHAYEPRITHHQLQKNLFTKKMCDELDSRTSDFDELILISPAKVLGELRSNLCKRTLEKVVAEIPKDVTKFTDRELVQFLDREM